jgi:branched-subunit amino acid ABC-type transport system permease component
MEILPQLLVNALISGSIYALASAGLALAFGLLKILNFAHGHIMMCGAYSFYFAAVEMGWPLPESFLFSAAVSWVISQLVLRVFVIPFMPYNNLLSFVTTLALATILESVVSMGFGVNVKSLSIGIDTQSFEIYGVFITRIQIIIIASALIGLTTLALLIHVTPLGRKIRALSENRFAAQAMAVNHSAIAHGVFFLGILLSVYAGILIGYETNLQPTMGNAYTIKAFAAMIFGGLGNIWGTIAGSYILGLIENLSIGLDFGAYSIPAGYKDAFAFAIILLVLLVRPQGLFSWRKRVA